MPYVYVLLFLLSGYSLSAQTEAQYITALAGHMGGQSEVAVSNGRVDILTDRYAIEVERAAKWKNSIGQALWYGLQTSKQPGIILLLENAADYRYAIMLESALEFAGIRHRVEVWRYPQDFPDVTVITASPSPPPGVGGRIAPRAQRPPTYQNGITDDAAVTDYWLNTNASPDKRHRRGCQWFGNTVKGRYCTPTEGVAAGCCGG